ncbi:MAG: hypothetical protein GX615_10740 [Lentisphaerae bacterium]|nr:hypothetical protein [Lentisphaerota bacterium]
MNRTAILCLAAAATARAAVDIPFALPPEPGTWLVTLAAAEKADPNRIVSTFVSGRPYTVTAENGGQFTASWDGLDENFMPVPPGDYALKGICARAERWPVDGEFHAVFPRYCGGVGAFLPDPATPDLQNVPIPFSGDPVSSPLLDVSAAQNGRIVLHYQYLENGRNAPLLDLNRPDGPAQVVQAFPSGGVGGGPCACTDGETVWACSRDGTPDFVYRADGRPFGSDRAPAREGGLLPPGRVQDLAAIPAADAGGERPVVCIAQRGRIVPVRNPEWNIDLPGESETDFVDEITFHDGRDGARLAAIPARRPRAVAVHLRRLFILQGGIAAGDAASVAVLPLAPDGRPAESAPSPLFDVPAGVDPCDMAIDAAGRFYLSDTVRNHVYRFSRDGRRLERTFGAADAQTPGAWDPLSFHAPTRLALRRAADGTERLLVVDSLGANRLTEWDAETGRYLRSYDSYQTFANSGWGPDPERPAEIYIPGHGGWLQRYRVDTATGRWSLQAVWPGLRSDRNLALNKFTVVRAGGRLYIASEENATVYRLSDDGRALLLSAAILREPGATVFWSDANGNGEIDEEEKRPCPELPPGVMTYHGQKWLADLSYCAIGQGTPDVWRLAPSSFDAHGNPVFTRWDKLLTDPVFVARRTGTATALTGLNELADDFSSDWMQADGTPGASFYVQARGGRNFTANYGAQHKISRYDIGPDGGYRLRWRVGRTDFQRSGASGELLGAMRLFKPVNGLLSVIDQSRGGVFLYTDDGLFVDTVFAPESLNREQGVYKQHGEFFGGTVYANSDNGRVYFCGGKFTPFLYEMRGWSLDENPVRALATLPASVTLPHAAIADPPEMAVALRGGPGAARVATVAPAFGGVELRDGSEKGWDRAAPILLPAGAGRSVEVRVLYAPDRLFLRWHVRTGVPVRPPALADPTRLFSHDQGADTLGFYCGEGDFATRLTFGLFRDASGAVGPVGMAFYPVWNEPAAHPAGYKTPVGEVRFAHVAPIVGADYGWRMDDDGLGFVLAAAVPRTNFPGWSAPFSGALRTRGNFEANLGGHHRFWWANTDGSASHETNDEPSEARFQPGSWAPIRFADADAGIVPSEWGLLGPFGGSGASGWSYDPSPADKPRVRDYFDTTVFPPDAAPGAPDAAAAYSGPETHGWWGGPADGALRWRAAPTAEVDSRAIVGLGAQLWYGAVRVVSERDLELPLELHSHPATHIRWFLNGEPIPVGETDYADDPSSNQFRRIATRRVRLRAGDNILLFRAYCVGYPPFRIGARLLASSKDVWSLRTTPLIPNP